MAKKNETVPKIKSKGSRTNKVEQIKQTKVTKKKKKKYYVMIKLSNNTLILSP